MYPLLNFKESNENKIEITQAGIIDIRQLYKCNKKCLPISYNFDDYIDFILSNNKIVLLAKINYATTGYIIGQHYPKINRLHIMSFAVYPQFRRQNIGTILMNKLITFSKKKFPKMNKISLYVMESNIIAQKFYLSMGFSINNEIQNYYSLDENAIVFIKNIE